MTYTSALEDVTSEVRQSPASSLWVFMTLGRRSM
jgi:hypothetical protein